MSQDGSHGDLRLRLDGLDYGEHGLTRHEMRDQYPALPDSIFLHLPDSKRFLNAAEVLREVRGSAARAEGEFIATDDDTGSAEGDYGPAGYGDSPLVSPTIVGTSGNTPLPGSDGNSLETEHEYPTSR